MALQFQAPPDWLVQGYLNRPNPVVEGLNSVAGVAQAYAQQKAAKEKLDMEQQSKDIEMAKGLAANGEDFTNALAQIKAARNPVAAPTDPSAGQPNPITGSGGPSLIERAMAHFRQKPVGQSPTQDNGMPSPDAGMPSPQAPSPADNGMPSFQPPTPSTGTASGYGAAPTPMSAATPVPTSPPTPPPGQEMPTFPSDPRQPAPLAKPSGVPVSNGFITPTGQIDQGVLADYKRLHGSAGAKQLETDLSNSDKLETAADRRAAKKVSFEDVDTTFTGANEKALGDKLVSDAKKKGLDYVPRESMDLALKGLGVKNQGMRGGAIDSMAETRRLQLRDSLIGEARKTMDPYFQTGAGKQIAQKFNRIATTEPLIQQMLAQKGGGDTRQMRELGTSVASLITNGNVVAQAQIEELVPKTYVGRMNAFLETLKNNPTGTEQQAFIQRFADTVAREKSAIQKQARGIAERSAPTLRVLKSQFPEDYNAVVDNYLKGSPELMGPTPGAPGQEAGGATVTIRDSQGGMHTLPSASLEAARKRDPGLQVVQ